MSRPKLKPNRTSTPTEVEIQRLSKKQPKSGLPHPSTVVGVNVPNFGGGRRPGPFNFCSAPRSEAVQLFCVKTFWRNVSTPTSAKKVVTHVWSPYSEGIQSPLHFLCASFAHFSRIGVRGGLPSPPGALGSGELFLVMWAPSLIFVCEFVQAVLLCILWAFLLEKSQ